MKLFKYIFTLSILFLISCKNNTNQEKNIKENTVVKQKTSINKDTILGGKKPLFLRNENEKASSFINRIYNNTVDLNHPIIETNKWIKDTNIILVFNNKELNENLGIDVEGSIFVSKNKRTYKKYIIDTYSPEGRNAKIESVFFVNADRDIDKELTIICSWEQRIKQIAEGKLYETFIYDNFDLKKNKLIKLDNISNHFGVEFEGTQEGVTSKAKYKTAINIKKELELLGFH